MINAMKSKEYRAPRKLAWLEWLNAAQKRVLEPRQTMVLSRAVQD